MDLHPPVSRLVIISVQSNKLTTDLNEVNYFSSLHQKIIKISLEKKTNSIEKFRLHGPDAAQKNNAQKAKS